MSIFEIVPNFSEGRNAETIDALISAAETTGARVLHRTSDAVHHRSVLTIAGRGSQLLNAAVALAGVARQRIDLRKHRGVHPRIGALDVLPFVPLGTATMEQAIELAHAAGQAIWERHGIPVVFYGNAAVRSEGRLLANVRHGEFEGLDARYADRNWVPDHGDVAKHSSAGAIAVGARDILIAFNVDLATGDVAVARDIASAIRERDGGLRTLRALGLRLSDRVTQVSLNITAYHATPVHRVVELIRRLAAQRGVAVLRSELIGLIPQDALASAARYYLGDIL